MGFLRERRRQAPLCCRHAAATAGTHQHPILIFFPPQAQIFFSFSLYVSFLMLWLFWLFLLLQHHSFPLLELSLTLFIFFWMVQLDVTAALKYPPSFTITFTIIHSCLPLPNIFHYPVHFPIYCTTCFFLNIFSICHSIFLLPFFSSHHPICIPRKVLMRVGWMPKDSHTHKHTSVDTYLLWQDLPSGVLLNLQWLKIEQRASVSFWQIKKKWRTDREEERERETRQEREWEV